jgi:predicted Zn-dependent peptidase
MLVTAAGAVDPEALYRPLERDFAPLEGRSGQGAERQPPQARPFAQYWHRPGLEQAQVIIGGPGLSIRDPRRHAYALLLSILGGGMSSRLFMKVREERGLVYSIHASIVPYSDAGFWYVTAATMPNRLPELLRVIREELDRIREEPVQPEELHLVQEQSRVNLFMSWESASDRMFTRAKQFVYQEPFQSLEEKVREVMAVTVEDTYAVAQQVFQPEALSCLILGDVPPAVIRDLPWPMELERREWPDG